MRNELTLVSEGFSKIEDESEPLTSLAESLEENDYDMEAVQGVESWFADYAKQ